MIVAFLVAGWVLGIAAGRLLPSKYRSETVILIEQQKVPEHYVEPNVSADLQQRLQSISQEILSRTRLLSLIEKNHLYGSDKPGIDADALVERMRKDISVDLVKTDGRREVSAFKISYSAPTPNTAKLITSELTSLFIGENLRNREELSEDTTTFLESQLNDARQSLAQQEERLRNFRSQYLGQLPEQLPGNLQILSGLQSQLQAATDTLNQAEQQNLYLRTLASQYHAPRSVPVSDGASSGPVTSASLDDQIAAVTAQLAADSARYTSRHPDVLRDQDQLSHLEALKAKLAQGVKNQSSPAAVGLGTEPPPPGRDSSAMTQVAGQLSANELEIANQKRKVKKLEEDIQVYQSRLNVTPEREQQSAAITRDYDQSRTYYESLLAKKLQSEMATNLEKRREGEQFRMIDPPNLPEKPYWPNRLAFSLAGLALGAAIGTGIGLALEASNPRIYDEAALAEIIEASITAAVPSLMTQDETKNKSRLRIFECIAAGLLVLIIPAVTLITYYKS
jgi:polysaccharide chain length determinant protein (PEP-CTERM system associated)